MMGLFKVAIAFGVLLLGVQVGRDVAHKFITPTTTA